ncbi:UNVERIFIED_CONTAM: hypothetical protein Sradi_6725800 [Sesamum radiatum]|uniref:Uncharacterized protein n=1 Tax=Sesamum radiatum TaxID=300843 RepID=A0AAW2JS81_SESRA
MCILKVLGGMGFRDLHAFNLAMLSKQVLSAKRGWNPSYTWRSLQATIDIVRGDFRWRIGSDRSMKVWQDPWLPRLFSFQVLTPPGANDPHLRVCDLIDDTSKDWNKALVRTLFWHDEAECILAILLSFVDGDDFFVWHHTTNGRTSPAVSQFVERFGGTGIVFSWNNHPFRRGTFSHLPPITSLPSSSFMPPPETLLNMPFLYVGLCRGSVRERYVDGRRKEEETARTKGRADLGGRRRRRRGRGREEETEGEEEEEDEAERDGRFGRCWGGGAKDLSARGEEVRLWEGRVARGRSVRKWKGVATRRRKGEVVGVGGGAREENGGLGTAAVAVVAAAVVR